MSDTVDLIALQVKKLNDLAEIPTRGSDEAAGYDLYAATDYDIWIKPHTTVKIDTGITIALPKGTFGAIFARSGLATKQGLRPANCVGVIDSDYRGPVVVALYNDSDDVQLIPSKSRIAQLVIIPYMISPIKVVDELNETNRGDGGFGSTGIK
jgi:dUTP pyrophosphatase